MAFRSIKVLADEVLRKAETVRAARNETVAEKLNGRPPSASDSLPMLPVVGSNGELGKEAPTEAEASSDREEQRQTAKVIQTTFDYGTRMRPVLTLVMSGRCLDRASPTRLPTSARSKHLLLVVIEGGLHASAF